MKMLLSFLMLVAAPAAQDQSAARPVSRLAQLNTDLESLVARVAPSVVQITAVGYAGLTPESSTTSALLAQQRVLAGLERQHAMITQPVGTAPHQHVAMRQREATGRVLTF